MVENFNLFTSEMLLDRYEQELLSYFHLTVTRCFLQANKSKENIDEIKKIILLKIEGVNLKTLQ